MFYGVYQSCETTMLVYIALQACDTTVAASWQLSTHRQISRMASFSSNAEEGHQKFSLKESFRDLNVN